jgi:hypothetical protein
METFKGYLSGLYYVQVVFVEQLYGSGMVDETEKESLLKPIEKAERQLFRVGTISHAPHITEVSHPLPPSCSAPIL